VVDSDFNSVYNYADRGRPLLLWIFSAKYNMHDEDKITESINRFKPVLTWPTGTKKLLFMKDLILMSREEARHRGRRKGSRNINKRKQIMSTKQVRTQQLPRLYIR
jgi:hypothetical protein